MDIITRIFLLTHNLHISFLAHVTHWHNSHCYIITRHGTINWWKIYQRHCKHIMYSHITGLKWDLIWWVMIIGIHHDLMVISTTSGHDWFHFHVDCYRPLMVTADQYISSYTLFLLYWKSNMNPREMFVARLICT